MSKHPKRLFFIRKSSQKIVVAQQNVRNWLILTYPIITFGNECPIGVHKKLLPYVLILPKKILVFTNYELSRTLTFLFNKWRVWITELLQEGLWKGILSTRARKLTFGNSLTSSFARSFRCTSLNNFVVAGKKAAKNS